MGHETLINPIIHIEFMVKSEKQRLHLEKLNSNQKRENNRGWKG